MDPFLKKLEYKAQPRVVVIAVPKDMKYILKEWYKTCGDIATTARPKDNFVVAFATNEADLRDAVENTFKTLTDKGKPHMWVVYPKEMADRPETEVTREKIGNIVGEYGYKIGAMVALDWDWSAVRLKRPN